MTETHTVCYALFKYISRYLWLKLWTIITVQNYGIGKENWATDILYSLQSTEVRTQLVCLCVHLIALNMYTWSYIYSKMPLKGTLSFKRFWWKNNSKSRGIILEVYWSWLFLDVLGKQIHLNIAKTVYLYVTNPEMETKSERKFKIISEKVYFSSDGKNIFAQLLLCFFSQVNQTKRRQCLQLMTVCFD